jgi:uracil-DNA glycosylase
MNLFEQAKEPLEFVERERRAGKAVYPSNDNVFRALDLTPIETVKIVILGQDPYHGEGQAHGLSFSVQKGVKIPPSLRNIYKELNADIGMNIPDHGFLEGWAKQGVLLLNTTLTVEAGQAASHQGQGWEDFTDQIIQQVNDQDRPIVFMLWGAHAQKKADMINGQKHLILKTTHPSPLSVHRGFLGCKHFSRANAFLEAHDQDAIDWRAL